MTHKFSTTDSARRETEEAFRKSDERFQRLADSVQEGVWELDSGGRTVFANRRLTELLGYTAVEFSGLGLTDLAFPDGEPQVRAAMEQVNRGENFEGELRLKRKDGACITLSCSASPVFDGHRAVSGAFVLVTDVGERKRSEEVVQRLHSELESRVQQRTAQLEAINKELEAFCYSVSHDLRAPLRTIRGFCEVLAEQYGPKLDVRGMDFLNRVQQASGHMDKLIDDLLKLSRVSRGGLREEPVNLSSIVLEISNALRQAEPSRAVEFSVARDITGYGDDRLVRVVLDNLLRNAWKFTARSSPARIEFGRMDGADGAFYVRDNGVGFDMNYAGKLFVLFQRLHSAVEYPGSGVGLAIVQRIINRHGGKVWAEGRVNGGATFYFTLPGNGQTQDTFAAPLRG